MKKNILLLLAALLFTVNFCLHGASKSRKEVALQTQKASDLATWVTTHPDSAYLLNAVAKQLEQDLAEEKKVSQELSKSKALISQDDIERLHFIKQTADSIKEEILEQVKEHIEEYFYLIIQEERFTLFDLDSCEWYRDLKGCFNMLFWGKEQTEPETSNVVLDREKRKQTRQSILEEVENLRKLSRKYKHR